MQNASAMWPVHSRHLTCIYVVRNCRLYGSATAWGVNMETQANKVPHSMMWIAGIAITLFCAAGIAAIMGWIPTSMGRSGDVVVPAAVSDAKTGTGKPVAPKSHTATSTAPARVASAAPVAQAAPQPVAPRAMCMDCGVIESSREVDVKGATTGLGAVGGAVVGGVLGNQVGSGRGNQVATVIGAVGGVVVGNEVERRVKTTKAYEITVRMEDGTSRTIQQASAPTWRAGDRVKIVDGAIRAI